MSSESEDRTRAVTRAFRRAVKDLLAGRLAIALARLDRCRALDPTFAPAYSVRSAIHVRLGRYDAARRDIDRALALRPGHIGDLHNRAVVRTALDLYDGAIEDYEAVLAQDPGSAGTWNNLAWVLATARSANVRDGVRAVACAREAIRSGRQPAWLDTLAAAHAECGHFDRAVAIEEEAWRRSSPRNESFRKRLELYRRHRTVANGRAEHDAARGSSETRRARRSPLR